MKKILVLVSSAIFLLAPTVSFAALNVLNGLNAANQFLVSPGTNATNTMHMDIVTVGTDTHRFRWNGTPWRVDQGGTGATSFTDGSILFYSNGFAQNNANLFWDFLNNTMSIGTNTPSPQSKLTVKGSVGQALLNLLSSLGVSQLFVAENGNVGLSNTNPLHKLDVSGALYSRLVAASGSTIDWNAGNVQSLTLTSPNTTLTFLNGQAGGQYSLILTQDGTGGRTVTWPSSVKWSGGNAPTLTASANATDLVNFVNNGSRYLGSFFLDYRTPAATGIAFDAATSCVGSSSCSVTTSGSNRALVAFVNGNVGTDQTPTCTYDGVTMTFVNKVQTPSDRWVYGFLLVGPSLGTHTLSCAGSAYIRIVSASYTGVQQSGQPDNHAVNSGANTSNLSTNYIVINANSWIISNSYFAIANQPFIKIDGAPTAQRVNNDGSTISDANGPVSAGVHTVEMGDDVATNMSQVIVSLIPE